MKEKIRISLPIPIGMLAAYFGFVEGYLVGQIIFYIILAFVAGVSLVINLVCITLFIQRDRILVNEVKARVYATRHASTLDRAMRYGVMLYYVAILTSTNNPVLAVIYATAIVSAEISGWLVRREIRLHNNKMANKEEVMAK